ncbi:hypothetical protein ACWGOQ_0012635 [Aquimarina sp. M1]
MKNTKEFKDENFEILTLGKVNHAKETRPTTTKNLVCLDYKPEKIDTDLFLTKPGSITMFFFEKNSSFKKEIVNAIRHPEEDSSKELKERLMSKFSDRSPISIEEAIDECLNAPSFAQINYGCKELANNLFVNKEIDLAVLPFPYNGGHIEASNFQMIEFLNDKEDIYDAILVKHDPILTPIEKEVLELVPSNMLETNIGSTSVCWAITAVAVYFTVIAATSLCPGQVENELELDNLINFSDPLLSAKRLLNARRELLSQNQV